MGVWIETHAVNKKDVRTASHPSWVCGLKRDVDPRELVKQIVTPFVGVWIETSYISSYVNQSAVTPFVGVWIETLCYPIFYDQTSVTPFVGVWIETKFFDTLIEIDDSHTLRGCVD